MKHRVFLAAILLTALAFSQSAKAYDFSAVAPSGQTLYYNIVGSNAQVTIQNGTYPYYSTYPVGALTIPNAVTYNGIAYPVTSINDSAFFVCIGLTSVTIPNSVTSIGDSAFFLCNDLISVTIPNSVTSIGDGAFEDCHHLTSVTIPNSVTTIGNRAFRGCLNMTSVNIPNSLTTIGDYTFQSCERLRTVTIPNSVTTIGTGAFHTCGLDTVTIGSSVTTIGDDAFSSCIGLTSVTIPDKVTTIGSHAFGCCSGLVSVTIKSSATIGDRAFQYCSGLTEITCLATAAPTLGRDVFLGVSSTIPVYIPCGSQGSYVSNWTHFSNFIETPGFVINAQSASIPRGSVAITTHPSCSDSTAVVTATARNGFRFTHWSDGTTSNPYTLTVDRDTTLIAYFVSNGGTDGIDNVDGENISVYVRDDRIVVTGAEGESVQVFDITGRPVNSHSPLPTGVYMVKVGNLPIRKVVVLK